MNKEEQIFQIIEKIKENKPEKVLKQMSNDLDSGMRFVLMFLYEEKAKVYASTISEKMGISRARVGVLLNKMQDKGLITKADSKTDARISVITLTEFGTLKCDEMLKDAHDYISAVIDAIGFDALNNFIDTACKIKGVLKQGGKID